MVINVGQGLLNALIFIGPLAIISLFFGMFFWERTCRTKIKVIVRKTAGGVDIIYAPKDGDDVTIHNPSLNTTRTWPISDLVTFPMPYPDLAGLLPRFVQREIQVVIFNEDDLEPILNNNPHRERIMSPDAVEYFRDIAERNPSVKKQIEDFIGGVSTGPTRVLTVSPAWIGALKVSTALKSLASVSDDLLESLKGIRNQLARFAGLNATMLYLGLGLILLLLGFNLYYTIQGANAEMLVKINAIYNALGIK